MKRTFVTYYLILYFLLSGSSEIPAQTHSSGAPGEMIHAWTDRTMYVSGEKIFFSAVTKEFTDTSKTEFSRILYCELITPEGKRITGGKYSLTNLLFHGCITIPEETISGIYYLRFYTRFMRNLSTGNYCYIMLKIVNPYKPDVLKGTRNPDSSGSFSNIEKTPVNESLFKISSNKTSFSPRETITITLQAENRNKALKGLCLSVIPENTFQRWSFNTDNTTDTFTQVNYVAETRGISLSGKLTEKNSGNPLPAARMNLSIIGDKDILVVKTDSSGRFFFAMPDYHGNKDIFLCADEVQDFVPEILIDNDFCSRPISLPSPAFSLDDKEMKAAYKLAANFKVHSVFDRDTVPEEKTIEENQSSFYGKPSSVLIFDKYIDMPTLEDYFTELPVIVKIKKVKGKKQFRFFSENIEMTMFAPVVLVDWVPVSDIEKILAMSPAEIDRIELVEHPYIKGDITFGGIISFISKKNDFAGIDLPKAGTFVNYSFLEGCTGNIHTGQLPDNIPDFRNTAYWNPDVKTDSAGTTDISFTAPDTPGNYQILLRGMSETNMEVLTEGLISVKKN